jgi:hypothetical protein
MWSWVVTLFPGTRQRVALLEKLLADKPALQKG